jgi:hypothetical protein
MSTMLRRKDSHANCVRVCIILCVLDSAVLSLKSSRYTRVAGVVGGRRAEAGRRCVSEMLDGHCRYHQHAATLRSLASTRSAVIRSPDGKPYRAMILHRAVLSARLGRKISSLAEARFTAATPGQASLSFTL